jgi:hypothetical protein
MKLVHQLESIVEVDKPPSTITPSSVAETSAPNVCRSLKTTLERALQEANNAVSLDNAQNFSSATCCGNRLAKLVAIGLRSLWRSLAIGLLSLYCHPEIGFMRPIYMGSLPL